MRSIIVCQGLDDLCQKKSYKNLVISFQILYLFGESSSVNSRWFISAIHAIQHIHTCYRWRAQIARDLDTDEIITNEQSASLVAESVYLCLSTPVIVHMANQTSDEGRFLILFQMVQLQPRLKKPGLNDKDYYSNQRLISKLRTISRSSITENNNSILLKWDYMKKVQLKVNPSHKSNHI